MPLAIPSHSLWVVVFCFSLARSGFFLFCSEFRPKIKSTNPGISIGDVAKKLGEMWNNLSDGEKQPYNNKAAKLKEKYEKVRLGGFSLGLLRV